MIGLARSSLHYRPAQRDDDALRLALIRLAKQYGRYGYRKITELLCIEGWKVNHKKVERFWREEGSQLPQRHKKGKRLYHKESFVIRLRPTHPNHDWAIDLMHDKFSNGHSYKMLTVLDEFARQALAVVVRTKMGAEDVLDALYPLPLKHGSPDTSGQTTARNSLLRQRRACFDALVQSRSAFIRDHPGRTAKASGSTAHCVERFSMQSGSRQRSRPKSSSINGSNSAITPVRIRRSTCVHLYQKPY